MEKAVFLTLLLMSAFWLSAGITSELEQDEPNSVSHLQLSKEEELFQLSWELTNPTDHVQGYSVKWEDGTSNSLAFKFLETLGQLDVPECSCGQKITITVSPFNKHGDPIGGSGRMLFICQDIVTIDSLTPEAETIDASWSVRCPSANLTGVMVMWHNDHYGYEMVCQYSLSIRNTSSKDGCHGRQYELHQCTTYEVSIRPQSDTIGYYGLLSEKHSRTLHGVSLSIRDLKYVQVDSDSATLSWRKPQCVVTGYLVSYSGEALWGKHRRDVGSIRVGEARSVNEESQVNRTVRVELLDIGSSIKSAVFNNLMPYSVYELCIAVTPMMNDTRNCIVIETWEEKPASPTSLSIDVVNGNNLNLMWHSPLNIRGKLRGYTVTWIKEADIIGSEKNSLETYTITGLKPCATYHISVTASTGAGDGEPVQQKVTIEEGCGSSSTMKIVDPIAAVAMVAGISIVIIIVWIKRHAIYQTLVKRRKKRFATASTYPLVAFSGLEGERDNIDSNFDEVQEPRGTSSEQVSINSQSFENKLEENADNQQNVQDHPVESETDMVGLRHFKKYTLRADPEKVFLLHTGLDRDGVDDFLSVIWEQDVKIIVMLEDCMQYWPASATTEQNWAIFAVEEKVERTWNNFTLRTVTLKKGDDSKSVKQFHLNDFSALGIPTTSEMISEMVSIVHEALVPGPCNVVVQISSREDLLHSFIGLIDLMMEEKKEPDNIRSRKSRRRPFHKNLH